MENDAVNHPKHYTSDFGNVKIECIGIARHLPFALGNAVKYIWRAGNKGGPEKALEDLQKAGWYWKDWCLTKTLIPFDFEDFTRKMTILSGAFFPPGTYLTVFNSARSEIRDENITVEDLKRCAIFALLSPDCSTDTPHILRALHKKFEEEMKNNGN